MVESYCPFTSHPIVNMTNHLRLSHLNNTIIQVIPVRLHQTKYSIKASAQMSLFFSHHLQPMDQITTVPCNYIALKLDPCQYHRYLTIHISTHLWCARDSKYRSIYYAPVYVLAGSVQDRRRVMCITLVRRECVDYSLSVKSVYICGVKQASIT